MKKQLQTLIEELDKHNRTALRNMLLLYREFKLNEESYEREYARNSSTTLDTEFSLRIEEIMNCVSLTKVEEPFGVIVRDEDGNEIWLDNIHEGIFLDGITIVNITTDYAFNERFVVFSDVVKGENIIDVLHIDGDNYEYSVEFTDKLSEDELTVVDICL